MGSRERSGADELLLGALPAGASVEDAAAAAGVSVRTGYRRLADPEFSRRLSVARDELLTAALGELVGCTTEAVATLRALLTAPDDRVRLAAAKCMFEQLLRLRETLALSQRLAALERAILDEHRGQP